MAYAQPSSFDAEKLLAHVNKKWGSRTCPMCNAGPWSVQDRAFQLLEFSQGSLVVGGPVIPVVPVTCTNCGNTVLVNALIAQAIEPPKPVGQP